MFGYYKPLNPYHMKKIYTLIFTTAFTFIAFVSNAATVNVAVGTNGSTLANEFFPAAVAANVGDVIQFTNAGGTHNVTSTSVPGGAAAMSSGTLTGLGASYSYTVTVAGTYSYTCTFHAGMNGTVNATVGIVTQTIDLLTSVYPNPFKERITLKYNAVEAIELYNVIGEKVKSFELPSNQTQTEIELSDLNAGIYFIRTYKEGVAVETKKIIKSK